MATVFFFLSVLVSLIHLIGYLCKPASASSETQGNSVNISPVPSPAKVAAITAAITTYESEMRK